jgi:hypothetical protein
MVWSDLFPIFVQLLMCSHHLALLFAYKIIVQSKKISFQLINVELSSVFCPHICPWNAPHCLFHLKPTLKGSNLTAILPNPIHSLINKNKVENWCMMFVPWEVTQLWICHKFPHCFFFAVFFYQLIYIVISVIFYNYINVKINKLSAQAFLDQTNRFR